MYTCNQWKLLPISFPGWFTAATIPFVAVAAFLMTAATKSTGAAGFASVCAAFEIDRRDGRRWERWERKRERK